MDIPIYELFGEKSLRLGENFLAERGIKDVW